MTDDGADHELVPLPLDLGHDGFSREGEDLVFRVLPVRGRERKKGGGMSSGIDDEEETKAGDELESFKAT